MGTLTAPPKAPPRYAKTRSRSLRIGYVPLIDCAPILVAQHEGLFDKYDLEVRLSAEPGWASIREKIIYEELDVAQCLGGLAFALNYGLGCIRQPVSIPLILSANGNAITLSKDIPINILLEENGLRNYLNTHQGQKRPFTLAAVHPFSSHNTLLHSWLSRQGVSVGQDVNIIYLPPSVLSRNLAAGTIDGFCVGEPWNSTSILSGEGWSVASSVDLDNGHPEKVLAVSQALVQTRKDDVIALTAAILEACKLCQSLDYRESLINLLDDYNVIDVSREHLENSLTGTFQTGHSEPRKLSDFHLFYGEEINAPTINKANWIITSLRQAGQITTKERLTGFESIFNTDLYEEALAAINNAVGANR